MKILIDTNVILDLLCDRKGFSEDAARIFKLCEVREIEGTISALSIPNIVYIMRKELDEERIQGIIRMLSSILTIEDLRGDDMLKAAALPMKDFEDALQSVCASRVKADFIVTRNIKDYAKSPVMAIKPSELLERVE
ncbi:MAG: PIN domain-containing protein [Clostridia bacterium]|nr:PIN domain-containing protein [Clostridia bacterium]